MRPKTMTQVRKQPGMSNAGEYPTVKKFAGPNGTFPIDTIARGRSALKLAHNAKNPGEVRAKVLAAYPTLKPKSPTAQPTMRRQREVAKRNRGS